MEKVVYFLGAGFSAPLGLPVTSNFLEKSKDLYFGDTDRYAHFALVLETIAEMSVVKNYYRTDLHNIEEILSILEMRQSLGGRKLKRAFLRYISDVVESFTPQFPSQSDGWPGNWHGNIFRSAGTPGRFFGYFVASLLHARLEAGKHIVPLTLKQSASSVQYSVVTLNYDTVLENLAAYLTGSFQGDFPGFSSPGEGGGARGTLLAKLHGSAATEIIVPPTWNKSVTRKLLPAWNAAFKALYQANQIRIIGYSLPTADSYVKYLLRAAAIEAPHLKRIDVLCLDDSKSSVYGRYSEFVDFQNFRFVKGRTEEYMKGVYNATVSRTQISDPGLEFNRLEDAHETFFTT